MTKPRTAQEQVSNWRKRAQNLGLTGTAICKRAGVPLDFFPQILRNPERQYGAWPFLEMLLNIFTAEQLHNFAVENAENWEPNIFHYLAIEKVLKAVENE